MPAFHGVRPWQSVCLLRGVRRVAARRKKEMKTKLLALLFLAGSSMFAGTRFFVGFGVGGYYPPPPPAPVVTYVAPSPGYGYAYVPGYYYPYGARYVWRAGYWARPPYAHA